MEVQLTAGDEAATGESAGVTAAAAAADAGGGGEDPSGWDDVVL